MDLLDIQRAIEQGCQNKNHVQLFRLYLEGWDYKEISGILPYTSDAAKQIVYNIKRKIRTKIDRTDIMNQ